MNSSRLNSKMKEKSFQYDKTPITMFSCCLGSLLSERHHFFLSLDDLVRRNGALLNAETAVCSDSETAGLGTDITLKFQSLETLIQLLRQNISTDIAFLHDEDVKWQRGCCSCT